ncbi:MAG: hypothetical protein EXS35_11850 [Pedosphaera sp.]|nr:hypothetical protein [Pedosphaera sp.]
MGENIQSIVAKKFRTHGNDAFRRRLMTPELFSSRPFICHHSYTCRATNGNILSVGDDVAVVRTKRGVEVWLESHVIGKIEGEDANELLEAFEVDPRAGKCVMGRVEDDVGLDGNFSIILTEGVQRVITPATAE